MGREYQFYVAVRITSRHNIDGFFTNHVVKEAWCAFLIEMGFDGRYSAIEEYIQLIYECDRTGNHHSGLTYFCFKVNVSSLEKHQTLFVGCKTDDFLCRQLLNYLFGICDCHRLTRIVRKIPFCQFKAGCPEEIQQSNGFYEFYGLQHLLFVSPILTFHTLDRHLNGTPAHGVGIGIFQVGIEVVENVVVNLLQIVCLMLCRLELGNGIGAFCRQESKE